MTLSFESFGLDPLVMRALKRMGYDKPTPVQEQAIPLVMNGHDVIALAQTGSGKTAACAIPVCHRVDPTSTKTQALIIVPTRELAMQYAQETQQIGHERNVKAFAICGGEDAGLQLSKIKHGVQVLVATPGRLIDFIHSRSIDLSDVGTLILDEADEMLGMGFYDDLEFIIQCLVHKHQTLLFSATMPNDIRKIAQNHMVDPLDVELIQKDRSPDRIKHGFIYCQHPDRTHELVEQMKHEEPNQSIVFCQSRIECEKLCGLLKKEMHDVDYLHGGLSQQLRTSITDKFRRGKIRHLIATDIAARGLDFSSVTHVFIYRLSDDVEQYVHRSGRTGRADRHGKAITLVTQRELPTLKRILSHINRTPLWIGSPPKSF